MLIVGFLASDHLLTLAPERTAREIDDMEVSTLYSIVQRESWAEVCNQVTKGQELPLSNPLSRLRLFAWKQGPLRVGGRLGESSGV